MYKEIESKIDNTIFEARIDDNEKIISYRISPSEGYKIHEITLDEPIIDGETGIETGGVKLGFTTHYITAGGNYDFDKNEREIYAVKIEEGYEK